MSIMRRQLCTAFVLACLLTTHCVAFSSPWQRLQQQGQISQSMVATKDASKQTAESLLTRAAQQRLLTGKISPLPLVTLYARGDDYDDDRERVLVPRRRGRSYNEDDDDDDDDEYYERQERRYYDEDDDDDDEYYEDEYEDEYEEFDVDFEFNRVQVDEEYASDILIPNPILDNVDPEGAGERFGEIARDPIFWRDLLLVIAVFNFCEYVAQVPYY